MTTFANPLTWLILLALTIAAAGFAWGIVRPTRRRHPAHGQTALFVVLGDAAVALAVVLIVAANGPVDWLQITAILLAALSAGGLPMIWEYIDDYTSQAAYTAQRHTLAQINTILAED